jgi:Arc/MetJ-type ribon-helix-helix transcriptional regulator
MRISFNPEIRSYPEEQVRAGRFSSISEVVYTVLATAK